MCSNYCRERMIGALEVLDATISAALTELDTDALSTPERLTVLAGIETVRRRLPALEHPLVNALAGDPWPTELGVNLRHHLAERLNITRTEARRRIDEAADLGPRRALTGEPLDPVLPATAAAQRDGLLDRAHVQVIRRFLHQLPGFIDAPTRAESEADLADYATGFNPTELDRLAATLADCHNPDGNFTDTDRARRRGITLGRQGPDGMTPITGCLDPQARATIDAVLARWAAPGMANPADDTPCLSGTPSQQAIDSDTRSAAHRNHDALTAMGRNLLASGELGQHNGLPATIIVSVTLDELESGAGKAHTGGGTWLPVTDVIRMASHAHLYLRLFDGAKELALFHTKRLASPGQRLVLYAKDRGCTHPGCPVPGYLTEVHHHQPYAQTGETDIHGLTLRCHPHHEIITTGGWTTRTNHHGHTETIPPAHLDHARPRTNNYHHPERLLRQNKNNRDNQDNPGSRDGRDREDAGNRNRDSHGDDGDDGDDGP